MPDETPAPSSPENSTRNRLGGIAVLVLAVAVAVGAGVWAFGRSDDESIAAGLLETSAADVGDHAPDFALVDARNPDKVIKLSDFAGTPVVLNWYASWCGPCQKEIPDFVRAQEALGDQVVILGVNLQESRSAALSVMDDFNATYPVVLDENGDIFAHYLISVGGMPTTYFIDADGIVQIRGAGRVTEDALVDSLALIGVDYTPPAEDS